jgi:hypothetical protein
LGASKQTNCVRALSIGCHLVCLVLVLLDSAVVDWSQVDGGDAKIRVA